MASTPIAVGDIIYGKSPDFKEGKRKICVCVMDDGTSWFMRVNSEPRHHTRNLKLEAKRYSFLNHDSYLDCSNITTTDYLKHCGKLLLDDVRRLRQKVEESYTISPRDKLVILASLDDLLSR